METHLSDSLNIYYSAYQSEILDTLWIASSDKGLLALRFGTNASEFITSLIEDFQNGVQPNIIADDEKLVPYLKALDQYFLHKAHIDPSLPVDFSALTEFQTQILSMIRKIPFGKTTTYGEIAADIDNPNAARAIGQVLKRNPIPIFIPCHRIINADGTIGGYGGVMGSERKIALLKHEGIIFT